VAIAAAPALLFRSKAYGWYLALLNLGTSIIFVMDLWYYRAFARFLSVHHLKELANLHHLSSSILSFIHPADFLLLLDAAALVAVLLFRKGVSAPLRPRRLPAFCVIIVLSSGYLFYFNATVLIEDDPLFSMRWVPLETIAVLSPIGYHLYDSFAYWTELRQLKLSQQERAEIAGWLKANKEHLPHNQYQGLFRNHNLILLQCESLENFVIGKKIRGQEITPNLNRIISNSFYFRNFMEQVGDGTSSDAEFMVNASVYPLQRGSVSWRYPQNTYNSLPKLLESKGYWTLDIHPDPGSYWNWMALMTGIGMKQCIDATSFANDEIIELGLSDGSFLRQSMSILARLKQPFYAYMITLTNHDPYAIPDKYRELQLEKTLDQSQVGGYLQSVHYMDKHIGLFLEHLNASGLLENTLVGIFGDHCGLHMFSREDLAKRPEHEQEWMENDKRVPLILYKKGMAGKRIDVIGGQIDMLPTIVSLLGVEENQFAGTAMGRNLLNTRRSFAVLNGGKYLASEGGKWEEKRALRGMRLSDKIIKSDYFKAK
jgi:phosphoglycerol transferase MdoB-like AlkP superfamily enzyme